MSKVIRNVFISSKYRTNKEEKPYDFQVYFPPEFIECQQEQQMSVNIINFHMPNSMYNINDNNNTISIIIRDKITTNIENLYAFTITNGNYNVFELKDHLNTVLTDYVLVSYSKIRNTYTFTKKLNDENKSVSIATNTGGNYLGLDNLVEYNLDTPVESVRPVNLVSFSKLVMNCEGLDFNGTIENISNNDGFEISNILFWCSRQDVANMAELTYQNEDGGNSFNYIINNKQIKNLRFIITDENYEKLEDLPDWTMIIQFSTEPKNSNEISSSLMIIQKYMLDIYSMIYLALSSLKII